jgi:hypothetical protein
MIKRKFLTSACYSKTTSIKEHYKISSLYDYDMTKDIEKIFHNNTE